MTIIPYNQTLLYVWNYKQKAIKEFKVTYETSLEIVEKLQERRKAEGKPPLQAIMKSRTKYHKAEGKTITRCKQLIWV